MGSVYLSSSTQVGIKWCFDDECFGTLESIDPTRKYPAYECLKTYWTPSVVKAVKIVICQDTVAVCPHQIA